MFRVGLEPTVAARNGATFPRSIPTPISLISYSLTRILLISSLAPAETIDIVLASVDLQAEIVVPKLNGTAERFRSVFSALKG
jgi:hypothetical protein